MELVLVRRLGPHQVPDEVVPPPPDHVRLPAEAMAPVYATDPNLTELTRALQGEDFYDHADEG